MIIQKNEFLNQLNDTATLSDHKSNKKIIHPPSKMIFLKKKDYSQAGQQSTESLTDTHHAKTQRRYVSVLQLFSITTQVTEVASASVLEG